MFKYIHYKNLHFKKVMAKKVITYGYFWAGYILTKGPHIKYQGDLWYLPDELKKIIINPFIFINLVDQIPDMFLISLI